LANEKPQLIGIQVLCALLSFLNLHSNSPDFTGSLPKIHAISWSPDFYQILSVFQNIQEIS
jgi:hypothetical protein